jgi:hypothetical protein
MPKGEITDVYYENHFTSTKTQALCELADSVLLTLEVSTLPTVSQCISTMVLTFSHRINKTASGSEQNNAREEYSRAPVSNDSVSAVYRGPKANCKIK